jgi:hypothetical protein
MVLVHSAYGEPELRRPAPDGGSTSEWMSSLEARLGREEAF